MDLFSSEFSEGKPMLSSAMLQLWNVVVRMRQEEIVLGHVEKK
jgi:hypothetical protein